ncbi:unnamed protein product [Cladocopium goreaui]|uniref:Ankyrin-1 (ANK-1) (Ankyrin-R) (Erythrocyte ankyrin) n=1 Tax=Cladocopium goreaui TaxID=2562237 RepID=A0A9P1BFN9_9DINO|nr:unnamed protein product [Cladocopium goreaui]
MWSYIGKSAIFLGGCCSGAAAATFLRAEERRRQVKAGEYYQLKGSYYQVLGHAWDHFRRDFCVVYRPLYHCEGFLGPSAVARESRFRRRAMAALALPPRPGQAAGKPKDDDERIRQELASLCVRGQVHQVVEALQKPELVKFASQPLDAAGASALHLAVLGGHLTFAQELINQNCAVDVQDDNGQEPLHVAAIEGHSDLVLELLMANANVNAPDGTGMTALHLSSLWGSIPSASVLLEHQANPTLRDNYGRTALFIAAEQGKTELMKFLLEKDVSTASIPNNEYWTPLHISAFGMQTVKNFTRPLKFLETVKVLLNAKVQLDAKDENCCTALHRAAQANNLEILRALLDAGADLSLEDECRWTPLHYASQFGYLKIVETLLDAKAEAAPKELTCSTPLSIATMENQVRTVELLLKYRADPEARAKGLHSPLMMAREGRFEAHVLATSHFERFNEFTKVSFDEMDLAAQSCALPGPFVEDKAWGLALQTKAVDGAGPSELQKSFLADVRNVKTPTTSGYGTRSHQETAIKRQL